MPFMPDRTARDGCPPVWGWPKRRVCKLLIGKGGFSRVPSTRVFCEKSLQVIEKKARRGEKERKERKRVRNRMEGKDLRRGL
jgi:hypothetical protein